MTSDTTTVYYFQILGESIEVRKPHGTTTLSRKLYHVSAVYHRGGH